jgi:hypothetical protein
MRLLRKREQPADDAPLQWIVPLTVAVMWRNTIIMAVTGAVMGWLVGAILWYGRFSAWPILVPFLCVAYLLITPRLMERWHRSNRAIDAIRASAMETGAWAVCAAAMLCWMGISPIPAVAGVFVVWIACTPKMLRRFWNQDERLRSRAACPACGHSLIGIKGVQCPECGYVFHEGELGMKRHDLVVQSEADLPEQPRF